MEVTPEIYAWLAELKILNAEKTIILKKEGTVLIDEDISNKFFNGFFIERILNDLENTYNKFYKIKLSYTQKLEEIKNIQENSKNNRFDRNKRSDIWKIIGQVTENFGIEINEEQNQKLSNLDISELSTLLNSIYTLSNELTKRSPEKKGINKYS